MLSKQNDTTQKVGIELLLRSSEAHRRLKRQRNSIIDLNQKLLFVELQSLSEFDESFESPKKKSPVPFHNLLLECSPHYGRIFKVSNDLKVPVVPCFKSLHRLSADFDPFKGYGEAPVIRDELRYVLKQKLTGGIHKQMIGLVSLNFAVYHEVLHALYYQLIPGPKSGSLKNYFRFIEALVFTHEHDLTVDLGEYVPAPLASISTMYRPFKNEKIIGYKLTDPEKIYLGLLATNLAYLHQWPRDRRALSLPKHAPNIPSRNVGFQKVFTHNISSTWADRNENRKFPEELRKKRIAKHPKFIIRDFDIHALLADRRQLRELWLWRKEVFGTV